MRRIEVLFSPAEFAALAGRRLPGTTCVVFDVLRATSSIVAALANGARAVIPMETIAEAVAAKKSDPGVVLAGEREGRRISAELAGGIEFDLGNSPREFTAAAAEGKTIVMTTTNGTRALNACRGADQTLAASFLNLRATASYLSAGTAGDLLLVCSGTHEEAALEDTLGAGALAEELWAGLGTVRAADSVQIARLIYRQFADGLLEAMHWARNGRRLLEIPELREDVPFCLQRDVCPVVARLEPDGRVVRLR